MKINWKIVAECEGYKSMKKAVADNAKNAARHGRKPDERYVETFRFVINRAKHYAYRKNTTIVNILNEWEEKRTYSFINYYQDCRQPKLHSNSIKPRGWRYLTKYYKTEYARRRNYKFLRNRYRTKVNRTPPVSKREKPRWSMERKKRAAGFYEQ